MTGVEVVPATAERFDDVVAILGRGWMCQYWRMTSSEYSRAGERERLDALRAQLAETPPAGLLAYESELPVGWLGFGVRPPPAAPLGPRWLMRLELSQLAEAVNPFESLGEHADQQ